MACTPSTLPAFAIKGQFQNGCKEDGTFGPIDVSVAIENPAGGIVCDPSNGAILGSGTLIPVRQSFDDVERDFELDGNNGCWYTCCLWATTAEDPNMALLPGGLTYQITVAAAGGPSFTVRGIPIDADTVTEESVDCGPCIDLKDLLPPFPTVPATDIFCDAVASCSVIVDLQSQVATNSADILANTEDLAALEAAVAAIDICAEMSGSHTVTFTTGDNPNAAPTGTMTGTGCTGFNIGLELPPCADRHCVTASDGSVVVITIVDGTASFTTLSGSPTSLT